MKRPERLSSMVRSRNARTGIRIKNTRIRTSASDSRMTRKQLFLITFMLFMFMGTGIGYVWSNFERTQIGYDLSQLKKDEMRLAEINQKLRLELAILKSPQNLEAVATRSLGLRHPSPGQIIVLP